MPVFPNTVHARIQPSIPLPESQPGCFKSIQHRAQLRSQPLHRKSAQRHALAWPSPSAHWHGGLPFMLHWQPTPSMIKPSPALQQQPALCIARLPLCCTDHPIGPLCTARLPVLLCNTAATPSPPRPHTSPPGPAALACRPCYGWRHMHCCCISAKDLTAGPPRPAALACWLCFGCRHVPHALLLHLQQSLTASPPRPPALAKAWRLPAALPAAAPAAPGCWLVEHPAATASPPPAARTREPSTCKYGVNIAGG